jgi:hypothetical protein
MRVAVLITHATVMALVAVEIAIANEDLGRAYYREVVEVGRQCAKDKHGSEAISCFVRASPRKCESYVVGAFTQQDDAQSSAKRAWAYCVSSCLNASFWSRHFGECSTELK